MLKNAKVQGLLVLALGGLLSRVIGSIVVIVVWLLIKPGFICRWRRRRGDGPGSCRRVLLGWGRFQAQNHALQFARIRGRS